ncbi:MAG: PQQ-binding-like beta-propeller repeat protein [Candidatus Methanoplasma sp.]|jgi:iron complex transport system permease protein|nr:PQQ-binding-like beta-propeller repeat protein [Candidatus Methanoplasma sp.]
MRAAAAVLAVFIVILVTVPCSVSDASPEGDALLIDYGNGDFEWFRTDTAGSYLDVLMSCRDDVVYDGSLTIGGIGRITISGNLSVSADWKIYSWNGSGWEYRGSDINSRFEGTSALGLFPDPAMLPSATPDDPAVWTQSGGSSGSGNTSPSRGPSAPALPVEWYNTYTTGYVDSGLVVSGGLLYHTTGGMYGAGGSDADPWIYCVDRNTGEVLWKYKGEYGAGYEVTTPAIAGDHLIVNTTNGDLYVFDRFNGDVLDISRIPFEPPTDPSGDIAWDGRVFVTGGTTPVYDSGCIFFGSADGRVYCYALSPAGKLTAVWCYDPPATVSSGVYTGSKGCFYYHAPVIADIGGTRMLFMGNYEGYIHALDITTGKAVWTKRAVDMRADNRCVPGTPGSVGSLSVSPDGTVLLASCTDGGLFTLSGYLSAMDPRTGDPLSFRDGAEWRLEGLFTSPVITPDGFFTYATPVGSDGGAPSADGRRPTSSAVYKFDWDGAVVWTSAEYQLIKAPMTLADGVLYMMDYSAGKFWPTGGGLTAISADDGSELWRVLLSPYTADSYSMVQPTVIDGKVYAANDFGAVYCLSATAGAGTEEEKLQALQTRGFNHWSWAAMAVAALLSLLFLARFY